MSQFIAYSAVQRNVRRREFQAAAVLVVVLTALDFVTTALSFHSGGVETGAIASGLGAFSPLMVVIRAGTPLALLGFTATCRDWALGRAVLWLPVLMFAAVAVSNLLVATGRSGIFG